jgi:hypothetical protein
MRTRAAQEDTARASADGMETARPASADEVMAPRQPASEPPSPRAGDPMAVGLPCFIAGSVSFGLAQAGVILADCHRRAHPGHAAAAARLYRRIRPRRPGAGAVSARRHPELAGAGQGRGLRGAGVRCPRRVPVCLYRGGGDRRPRAAARPAAAPVIRPASTARVCQACRGTRARPPARRTQGWSSPARGGVSRRARSSPISTQGTATAPSRAADGCRAASAGRRGAYCASAIDVATLLAARLKAFTVPGSRRADVARGCRSRRSRRLCRARGARSARQART